MSEFVWDDKVRVAEKIDGSLITLYCYDNEWMVNTRGSFGNGELNNTGRSWSEWVWGCLERSTVKQLDPAFSYVMEFVSPFNKVVRLYPTPTLYLLTIVRNDGVEKTHQECDEIASLLGISRPQVFDLKEPIALRSFLKEHVEGDPTFEGFVAIDRNTNRVKFKSELYVHLHHLVDNGNLFNVNRLVPIVLAGEADEVVTYLPEIEPYIREVEAKIDAAWRQLVDVWERYRDIEAQKDFAQTVIGKTPFTNILFNIRKCNGGEQKLEHLKRAWQDSEQSILKNIFGK